MTLILPAQRRKASDDPLSVFETQIFYGLHYHRFQLLNTAMKDIFELIDRIC